VAKSHLMFFELDADIFDTYFYGSERRAVGAQNSRRKYVGKILYFVRVNLAGFGQDVDACGDHDGKFEESDGTSKRHAFVARVDVYKPWDAANPYYKATGLRVLDLRSTYRTVRWLDARHIGRPVVTGQHWDSNFGHQLVILEGKT
jgi:hypothetical protein